jgi:hypothetical protein
MDILLHLSNSIIKGEETTSSDSGTIYPILRDILLFFQKDGLSLRQILAMRIVAERTLKT